MTELKNKNIVKGKIANALTSAAKNHIVATTDDLYDTNFEEYQDEINKHLRDDMDGFLSGLTVVDDKVVALNGKVDEISVKVANVEGDVNNISAWTVEADGIIKNHEERIVVLESHSGDTDPRVDELIAWSGVTEPRVEELEEKSEEIEGRLDTVESSLTVVENNIESLDNRVTVNEGNIENLTIWTESTDEEINSINSSLTIVEENISDIDNRVTNVEGDINIIQSSVTELTTVVSTKIDRSIFDTQSSVEPTEEDRKFVYRDQNDNIMVVDKEESGGDYVWRKITSFGDLESDSEYLFVNENDSVIFDGSKSGSTLNSSAAVYSVTINNNEIADSEDIENRCFTISNYDDAFSIKSKSGYYIGKLQDGNGMDVNVSIIYKNSISFETNGDIKVTASGGSVLRRNSGGNLFRYYKSSSYTGQKPIQIYKKVSSGGGSITYKWRVLGGGSDVEAIPENDLERILVIN